MFFGVISYAVYVLGRTSPFYYNWGLAYVSMVLRLFQNPNENDGSANQEADKIFFEVASFFFMGMFFLTSFRVIILTRHLELKDRFHETISAIATIRAKQTTKKWEAVRVFIKEHRHSNSSLVTLALHAYRIMRVSP